MESHTRINATQNEAEEWREQQQPIVQGVYLFSTQTSPHTDLRLAHYIRPTAKILVGDILLDTSDESLRPPEDHFHA